MLKRPETALSLAARIRSGELSALEATEQTLSRIDAVNPKLNAIIWRDDTDARARAARADDVLANHRGEPDTLPPFLGVPIPIKELNDVAGWPNTMGSLGVSEGPRPRNDLVVDLLEKAGFVLLGRSNAPEMGPMSVTENLRYGITRNPWNLAHSPGGSSGGAAASVASGMFSVAHASDGGGSIRVPSSSCGLVGLKPSRGRVPARVMSWEASVTDGVVTRTVADTAAVLDVIGVRDDNLYYPSAPEPLRPFLSEVGADGPRLRIGLLLEAPTGLPVDAECIEAAVKTAEILEKLGHQIFPASPTFYSREAIEGFLEVVINASLYIYPWEDQSKAEQFIQFRMQRALDFHAGHYTMAAARLHEETPAVRAQWGRDFDVLLTPTMATLPPLAGAITHEANTDWHGGRETEIRMISFTAVSNISGLPAISLPIHMSKSGLPVGAQLVGGPFGEGSLLRLAAEIETAVGWLDRVAPVHAE